MQNHCGVCPMVEKSAINFYKPTMRDQVDVKNIK